MIAFLLRRQNLKPLLSYIMILCITVAFLSTHKDQHWLLLSYGYQTVMMLRYYNSSTGGPDPSQPSVTDFLTVKNAKLMPVSGIKLDHNLYLISSHIQKRSLLSLAQGWPVLTSKLFPSAKSPANTDLSEFQVYWVFA